MKRKKKIISSFIILVIVGIFYLFQNYPIENNQDNVNKRLDEAPFIAAERL